MMVLGDRGLRGMAVRKVCGSIADRSLRGTAVRKGSESLGAGFAAGG